MSASLAPECNEVKEKYDNCFLKWYSEEFLKSSSSTSQTKEKCDELFKTYKECLTGALKAKGIDKLVEEAREDHREADAMYMDRSPKKP